MHSTEPKSILKSLIQGSDPGSGERLPPECVVHRPDVLRAMLAGFDALNMAAARAQRRAQLPDNVGSAWTTEEENRLVSAFKSGESPTAIAHKHGRTLRAIEARLQKLGLITEEERTTRGGFTAS
jgi:Myb-like DNA-binding domain